MSTNKRGLVYLIRGDGKGKTSSAVGIMVRSLAIKKKVSWISWYKNEDWSIGENKLKGMLSPQYNKYLSMYWMGKGFFLKNSTNEIKIGRRSIKIEPVGKLGFVVTDTESSEIHSAAAKQALVLARAILKEKKDYLLVLDEILNAVADELITQEEVFSLIKLRGLTNIVLTGRGIYPKLEKVVNLISDIQKIKHPYDVGQLAVPGLDF